MMKVDSNIVKAIELYVKNNTDGFVDFAQKFGISPAALTKWRKVGSGITNKKWQQLLPLIRKYLPDDRFYIDDAGNEQYSSVTAKQSSYYFEPKYIPIMVPTFTPEQLSDYDDMLESITQYGANLKVKTSEYRPKHQQKTSIMAVKIDSKDFEPMLPANSTLFVCTGERPHDNCIVIAKLVSGDIIIGKYNRSSNDFTIRDFSSGELLQGTASDVRSIITWIFPVLYYEVITF